MANIRSAIKRVRQTARKRAVNQPRRSAAKTLVARALLAGTGGDADAARQAYAEAASALDRAANSGAIHRNSAARRKSRLALKMNAALGGEALVGVAKPTRSTGKAAAAKAAKARVAASRATKAKGEQTAAGKARAALRRTTRGDAAAAATAPEGSSESTTTAPRATGGAATRTTAAGKTASGSSARKSAAAKPSSGSKAGTSRTSAGASKVTKTTASRKATGKKS